MLVRAFQAFSRVIRNSPEDNPLVFNSLVTGCLMGMGDFLAQYLDYQLHKSKDADGETSAETTADHGGDGKAAVKFTWNKTRTFGFAGIGFLAQGPGLHHWYRLLDKWYPTAAPKHVVKKILWDQFVCAPLFYVALLPTVAFIEGESPKAAIKKLPSLWLFDCTFWPFANYVNFALVPLSMRVFYVDSVSLFWDAFLSWFAHK